MKVFCVEADISADLGFAQCISHLENKPPLFSSPSQFGIQHRCHVTLLVNIRQFPLPEQSISKELSILYLRSECQGYQNQFQMQTKPPAIEEVNIKSFPGVIKQYPISNLCTCLVEQLFAFHSFALCIFLFIVFSLLLSNCLPSLLGFLFFVFFREDTCQEFKKPIYLLPSLDLLSFQQEKEH